MRQVCVLFCAPLLIAADFTPQQAAKVFGSRESIESISLSPDGSHLSYSAPTSGQGSALYAVDLATGTSQRATAVDGAKQRLAGCNWVSSGRVVCTVYAMLSDGAEIYPVSRVVALDTDGTNVKLLSEKTSVYQKRASLYGGRVIDWLPGQDGTVLMGRDHVPEIRQGTRLEKKENGYGVDRVDTKTLSVRRVETPRLNAVEYISDGHGKIRIMGTQPPKGASGMTGRTVNYLYRTKTSNEWRTLGNYDVITNEGSNPLAVDPQLDVAYVLEKTNGKQALYRVSLDGALRKELVFAHPHVDVDGVIRIGRSMRVVGATYATEKREATYFDQELKRLAASLSKALPGLPLIRFVDSTVDERKLLIWAGSDTDPGRYYLYDKGTRQLSELMLSRPQLEGVKLASVKPVTYRASDGTMIPAYLTLPPGSSGKGLPAIVMPHGGPSARDEWGFDWLAQFYANRGFAVLQPNFRGSAGYGDEWFKKNGFQSWRTAIGDVVDAGRWLIAEGVAEPSKLAILGWSYGGYAALQSNVVDPNLFRAVVAIAPVTDLNLLKEQYRNWTNFALASDYIGSGPHIQQGSPARNAAAIKAPVLLFHGELDDNVDVNASSLMHDRLRDLGKPVEFVRYPKLDHYLEDSDARVDMLLRSDSFLRSALKL
jgi:dipeptidyl aminopeptidase/acylaminoacyl peptidase